MSFNKKTVTYKNNQLPIVWRDASIENGFYSVGVADH
ncbi:hypothetical protein T4D_13816 [Trichinella pseudospiralis]|uniref:Uncharacterized protein n=1 Tax=Trichinella pseudospiralis TaxID=6337 RepID=A0A0V1DND0_TRIPS|nr:hypothetical protein T4D_13816 [Trichinella pseudospiralis]